MLKLIFLLFWDNVRSERELMRVLPERLDYLWFLGYTLDDETPTRSVLSKARRRWGGEVFESLFVRSVAQCVDAGLVGGELLHVDGSHIDADASKDSVVKSDPEMIFRLREIYGAQEAKLDSARGAPKSRIPVNCSLISATDPDSACVKKKVASESRPRYKAHRAVDDEHGVITATETTPGDVEENARMKPLIEQSERNAGAKPSAVAADSQYGTMENFRDVTAKGIAPCMKPYRGGSRSELYGSDKFEYDPRADTYRCPQGNILYPRSPDKIRMGVEYVVRKGSCDGCPLKAECTKAKTGRTILRRWGQDLIDEGIAASTTPRAKSMLRRRQWVMEGSFAQSSNRHGFKRSRWRRIWRQRIQDHIICAIRNIEILISRRGLSPIEAANAAAISPIRPPERLGIGRYPLCPA